MPVSKKIKFCQNHLTQLYEALKADNIHLVKEIEHQLTTSEECVACAYLFKTKGEAANLLKDFLKSEGFAVE